MDSVGVLKTPVEVFISYSHRDEGLRRALDEHLSLLQRERLISTWHDRRIGAGAAWKNEIDAHLETASVILLLISAAFLASDYCYDIEMKRALQRDELGEARVIPIILRPVERGWASSPFAKLQPLPKDAKPVTKWGNRDEAFANVASGIRAIVESLVQERETSIAAQDMRIRVGLESRPERGRGSSGEDGRWDRVAGGEALIEVERTGMLGKRSAQRGLFEADTLFRDFVGQRTFYTYLASQRDELFRDEDFAALYCRDNGRPSVPPSLLATALVLQTYDDVSDDEAKQRADYDLRWKVALGVELETRPFAKSTLQEFRAQLILHDQARTIFQRSLEIAKHRGVWKKGHAPEERKHIKLALDTTHILGRGAVRDTYNLLADGVVQVLRGLAKLVKCDLLEVAEEVGCTRYVQGPSLKGQAEVDWGDPRARQQFLAEIVTDAEQLLDLVRGTRATLEDNSPADQELVAAAEVLARILAQDIERDDQGPRLKRGVAPDRLISVHDPEMRHGRKSSSQRFNGHKAQVAVDTDSQLITAVDVLPGNAPDAERALEVVEASEAATDCRVEEVLGDCAYGAGETRAELAATGRTIVAKVPESYNGGLFAKTAFDIDLETRKCTCPNGQTTTDLRLTRDGGGTFVFATETCAVCPVRTQCTRGRGGRTVHLHPQEALLQQARELQRSPAFAEARRRRQVVEHRIARLVHLGIRQARYFGRTKTLFQVCLAAAVANLTLLATTSDTFNIGHLTAGIVLLGVLAATLSLISALAIIHGAAILYRLVRPVPSLTHPLQAGSRPAF